MAYLYQTESPKKLVYVKKAKSVICPERIAGDYYLLCREESGDFLFLCL